MCAMQMIPEKPPANGLNEIGIPVPGMVNCKNFKKSK